MNAYETTLSGTSVPLKSTNNALHVSLQGDATYPAGATAVTSSSGNVAAAAASATLAAVAGKTNYVTGFEITGGGATAGLNVIATLVGLLSGTASYIVTAAVGVLVGNRPVVVQFSPAIPASAVNTALVLSVPSLGLGNTHSAVVLHGYYI